MSSSVRHIVYNCPADHKDGLLYLRGWVREPEDPSLVLVHDLGQTTEVLASFANELSEAGFNVYGYDLRWRKAPGESRSKENRPFSWLSKDLLQVCAWVRKVHEGRSPLLLGFGVGSTVALLLARYHEKFCSGLALVDLVVDPPGDLFPAYQMLFYRALAEVLPNASVPHKFLPRQIRTRIKERATFTPWCSSSLVHELIMGSAPSKKLLIRNKPPTLCFLPESKRTLRTIQDVLARDQVEQKISWHWYTHEELVKGLFLDPMDTAHRHLIISSIKNWLASKTTSDS